MVGFTCAVFGSNHTVSNPQLYAVSLMIKFVFVCAIFGSNQYCFASAAIHSSLMIKFVKFLPPFLDI